MSAARPFAAAFLVALAATSAARAEAPVVTAAEGDRQGLALTIYNQGSALVSDRRAVSLPAGEARLEFPGLPREVQDTGAVLRADGVAVLRQSVDTALPTDDTLLTALVGQEIGFERVNPATGAVEVVRGRLLSAPPALLVEVDGRIRTTLPGDPVYDSLPGSVRLQPAWSGLVKADKAVQQATLSYLTGGLGWRAEYMITLARDGRTLDIDALASLHNGTATSYPAAAVKLVAGDIARPPEDQMMMAKAGRGGMEMAAMPAAAPQMADAAREQIGAFHLYTLDGAVDIPAGRTVQHALLAARGVPVTTEYYLDGPPHVIYNQIPEEQPAHVETRLTFRNSTESKLGKPLPAGTARVFAPDASGALQLVGAARLDHIGEGRTAYVSLGRAFDVTATRVQTDFKRLSDRMTESAHRITLANGSDKPVTVLVRETIGGQWEMLEASAPHDKTRSDQASWTVEVPAKGEAQVTYRVRAQF
ncbi:DUF4139 domain-containing protein [Caenispirillum bisanense]|uniref:DUF4139 domain-containing protein n=1 Tax=Caenispirillum bisanense TaxID=414052 RepID=UPI0031CE8047